MTLTGSGYQTHDYYMTIGPLFTDPIARQLCAEIASIESQHIVHCGSMINPDESPLEKMLRQEACEDKNGTEFVPEEEEGESSLAYREQMNRDGSPSELVSATYRWTAGTELARPIATEAA